MAYQVILIESDRELMNEVLTPLKRSSEFTIAATYTSAHAAIGQANMFQPNLFLMDVEDDEELEMLPAFADIFPGAYILGMMSVWDADRAYRSLHGGATGCILKPFTAQDILKSLQLFTARGAHKAGRIVSFFSAKGRAGRTTLAAILALIIANKTGEKVALIDADLQFGDLPIFFDATPKRSIIDASQDIKLLNPLTFEPYFYPINSKVSLLSSPDKPEYAELVTPASLVDVVRMTENLFRYVLVDLPAGFNPLAINVCRLSNLVYVTTMINTGFEVRHVKKAMEMFASQATPEREIRTVFTRVNPFTEEERHKIERELGYPVDDMIPNEYKMISIANSGRLSHGLPEDTLLMRTISGMADRIIAGGK